MGETFTLDPEVPGLAADHLDAYGWARRWGTYGLGTTERTCAHGAVLSVCGAHPGDQYMWRPILRARGLTEFEQDLHDKRWATRRLRRYEAPTVGEMAEAFGPNWEQVRTVVRQAATITGKQAKQLSAARVATRDAAWYAAWYATRYAAWNVARVVARDAVWAAARADAWDAGVPALAVADVVSAACVADLIGQHGFTQAHYDELLAPWRAEFPDL